MKFEEIKAVAVKTLPVVQSKLRTYTKNSPNLDFPVGAIHELPLPRVVFISFPVSDWECRSRGSASLAGGRAATINISSLWLETSF
ncbi:hypothetical protein [Nostoc sp.]|uniref:hypothetical protein n=1 Tax=Nostoc sp. TaxID=1180 RepID=UPI002FFB44F5